MLIRNVEHQAETHVDFVPMVDVLFNLLIFFLLATSMAQAEREMQIALPQAATSGPISAAIREIVINVDEEGRSIVAGKVVGDEELASLLNAAVGANPEQKVNVRGDRATAYANVVRVLDLCKAAGIREPFLETVPVR
ncbi:MAG: Biopolymer transport protein ExbD [Phycisphaerales bacterium]|nr:Biopolymer transport protein ExbD [Phycisphaerales bacterium]